MQGESTSRDIGPIELIVAVAAIAGALFVAVRGHSERTARCVSDRRSPAEQRYREQLETRRVEEPEPIAETA